MLYRQGMLIRSLFGCLTMGVLWDRRPFWMTPSYRFGLVTPYGNIYLGQLWPRCWFVIWRHKAMAWSILTSHQRCSVAFTGEQSHMNCSWHDDVIKWKHFQRYWPYVRGIHRSPVNSPHKGQGRGVLMFSLICSWINGCVNNGEAGDLRRHRAHYDVILMYTVRRLLELYLLAINKLINNIVDKANNEERRRILRCEAVEEQ